MIRLILTHGDMDHIGGAISIIKEIECKTNTIVRHVMQPSDTEVQIIEEAKEEGNFSYERFLKENNGRVVAASFFVLKSRKEFYSGERNRGSITIFAEIGGIRWFFGGDLDQEGEEENHKKISKFKS